MLVVMNLDATEEQIKSVVDLIGAKGYTARPIPGGERVSIGILNNSGPVDANLFVGLPGVKEAIPVTRPYKLVSREFKNTATVVRTGGVFHRRRPFYNDRRSLRRGK